MHKTTVNSVVGVCRVDDHICAEWLTNFVAQDAVLAANLEGLKAACGDLRPDDVNFTQIGIIIFFVVLTTSISVFAVYNFISKTNNADGNRYEFICTICQHCLVRHWQHCDCFVVAGHRINF